MFNRLAIGLALFCLASGTLGAVRDAQTTPSLSAFEEAALQGPHVRVHLRYYGVCRIWGADLAATGLDLSKVDATKLALWNAGKQVPLLVSAQAPPRFGEKDYFEFIGEPPRGTYSWFMPYNLHNVYLLRWNEQEPVRYLPEVIRPAGTESPLTFINERHHETDNYYQHSALPPGTTDNFFWLHYRAGQGAMYPLRLDFPGLDRSSSLPIQFKFRVFGMNDPTTTKPHHRLDVMYDKTSLGGFEFNGKQYFDFHTSMPVSAASTQKLISFVTPPGRESAIDWTMLDSIDVKYPRHLDAEGASLFTFSNSLVTSASHQTFRLSGVPPGTRVFCPDRQTVYVQDKPSADYVMVRNHSLPTTYTAVSPNGGYDVDMLELVESTRAVAEVSPDTQLLIVHPPSLNKPAHFLQAYRRAQGMNVLTADVRKVFDVLNDGFISDDALKRYIRFVKSQAPGLKYLLLLGDSTIDYRESSTTQFPHPRVLIPIHWVVNPATTWTGGYPDDNWYGAFGPSNYPDIAVGRIPANDDEEAFAYIRKVVEYEQLRLSANDPALFVSSVEKSFQDLVLETNKSISDHFSTTTILFPETQTADREVARLRDELSSGIQLMYYVGHGGSFVWRVGPVDFSKQKDLFTPAEVQKMNNKGHYPIITCSSCYTTSFDNVYSLGEAFIGKRDGGAIAIIGTPWKSTVYEDHMFNQHFLKSYVNKDLKTLGEAFLSAKNAMRPDRVDQVDTQSFTLLGDPCLHLVRKQ